MEKKFILLILFILFTCIGSSTQIYFTNKIENDLSDNIKILSYLISAIYLIINIILIIFIIIILKTKHNVNIIINMIIIIFIVILFILSIIYLINIRKLNDNSNNKNFKEISYVMVSFGILLLPLLLFIIYNL